MVRRRTPLFPPGARQALGLPLIVAASALAVIAFARLCPPITLPIPLCLLNEVTGLPCPLCGGIRSLQSLARGDPGTALATNPLVAGGTLAVLAWPLVTLVPWPAPVRTGWRWLARRAVILPLVLLHWAYLIWRALA